jgi:hypothetical protein
MIFVFFTYNKIFLIDKDYAKIKLFLNFFIKYIINEMSSLINYHKLKIFFQK